MSQMGQSLHFDRAPITSGPPRKADILRVRRHVSKVPRIGIGGSLAAPPLPHHRTYGFVYGGSRSYANALRSNDSTRCLDTPKHGIYSFPLVVPVRSHLLECSFHFLSPSACAVLARHRAMGRKYLSLLISSPSAPSLTSGLIASEAGREYRGVDTNYQCGATCASTVRRIGSDGKQGSPARCRLRGRARRAGRAARGVPSSSAVTTIQWMSARCYRDRVNGDLSLRAFDRNAQLERLLENCGCWPPHTIGDGLPSTKRTGRLTAIPRCGCVGGCAPSTKSGDAKAGPIHSRTFTGTSGSYV